MMVQFLPQPMVHQQFAVLKELLQLVNWCLDI